MATDYYLTVQAVDGGDQPQHDLTTVNINVTDANDNSPIFNQQIYSTDINEAAQVGDSVLQVIATDADSGFNGDVIYTIQRGDRLNQFHIGSKSGLISITSELDREQMSAYTLTIRASDQGHDPQFTDVTIQIRVSDINDNPPRFSQDNYTVIAQEDTEINAPLQQFFITDLDAPPNGSPFKIEIVGGNEGNEFRISRDSILRPMIRFNQGQKDNYILKVRVTDSGTPAMWSEAHVEVKVIISKHPPVVSSPMEVTINSYQDDFPGGVIGMIHAVDNDEYDTLTYALVSNNGHLFMVNSNDGMIIALPDLDIGFYILNISVSDNKHISYGEVRVNVVMVTQDTLENSLTIRFSGISPEVFLEGYYRIFTRTLKNMLLSVQPDDIQMVSLQETDFDSGDLDVLFAVEKSPNTYYKPKPLVRKINDSIASLEERMGVSVAEIFTSVCLLDTCDKTTRCKDSLTLDQSTIAAVYSTRTSFVSAKHVRSYTCVCKEKSDSCEEPTTEEPGNACDNDPCPEHMICLPAGTIDYSCVCPDNSVDDDCVDPRFRPVSFSGSSYIHYNNLVLDTTSTRVSAKVRTMKSHGNIMYGTGDYDYSILEIENGLLQYRFQCGSGEGLVQIVQKIDDGQWHDVSVHRRGNSAKLVLDNQYVENGDAPGDKRELNLDDIFFGAEVESDARRRRDPISQYGSISNGLDGCMSNLNLNGERLPTSGDDVQSNGVGECPYSIRSACLSSPCVNGATCLDIDGTFQCNCMMNWFGDRCQFTSPCGPSPCRNGGTCINEKTDFRCECPEGLYGKTCTNYCIPNPCLHGGLCIESDDGPICECRGFTGPYCNEDINECLDNPCNGGMCTNTPGGFTCNCTIDRQGPDCNEVSAFSPHITTSNFLITWQEIVGIIAALLGLTLLVIFFVACRKYRRRKNYKGKKRQTNLNDSLTRDANTLMLHRMDNLGGDKRDSKLSNLEVNFQPSNNMPPEIPNRPTSYTPSNHNSLNNLDSDRNYDENDQNAYQGQPVSQPPTLGPMPPSNSASDSDSIAKPPWDFNETTPPNVTGTENYDNMCNKLNDPDANNVPKNVVSEETPGYRQRDGTNTNYSSLSSLQSENDEDMLPGYHWDCTDWMPPENLPDISELPQYEVPDSPTNSNGTNTNDFIIEDEYVGEDTDYPEDPSDIQYPHNIDDFQRQLENYPPPPPPPPPPQHPEEGSQYGSYQHKENLYKQHPSHYLPHHSYSNSQTSQDMYGSGLDMYGPAPRYHNNVAGPQDEIPMADEDEYDDGSECNADCEHSVSNLDNLSISVYSTDASCSDVSALYEPDSEMGLSDCESGDDNLSHLSTLHAEV
ncbi:FAT tumor suppressor-like protein [Saccoglossus kowalevskii]|uniref:FAT tumor suppressor-like protein n=1 Tax=Saccoglossus kowalevskii TaxID=10224 RepID=D1LX05_SACKO|nr:FAT tumor suppressor-like protein [Saccoglossus kowalevskii]ACY92511.1 FAT tumor suppressor-like protein [Saccoglossus kowalevskii]